MTIGFNHLGKLGQLGNQMFQYAALRGIAYKNGVDFKLPNHQEIFDDGIGNRYGILLFDGFKLTHAKNQHYLLKDGETFGMLDTDNYVSESYFHFDEKMFNLITGDDITVNMDGGVGGSWTVNDDVSLWGFFQSEKYFDHIAFQIRDDFGFKDEILNECRKVIVQFDKPISLHIRRGDFLTNSGNHPPLGLDYYEKALSMFESDRQVIIFSDDTKWCKEQKLFEDDRFAVSEGSDQFHDMCLMSLCDDFIIANSSFSWWGAWLAKNICNPPRPTYFNGKVIAPKKWFGPNLNHDTKDLFPPEWIVI
tara:strand:- start:185 stop:1102 length:918 start_codon:yes stop_codon:yes gene_type:complete